MKLKAVASQMQKHSFEKYGYEEYEYIAEPKACDICKPLNGKIFKVKEMMPGENAAPMHPHCRCSVAAHYSERDGVINVEELFDFTTENWEAFSSKRYNREELISLIPFEKAKIGELPNALSDIINNSSVFIDRKSYATSIERHASQFSLEEFKLIEKAVTNPMIVFDNSARIEKSFISYVGIPEKDRVVMEAVVIPKKEGLIIHFAKVGIRNLKKQKGKVLYKSE